MGEINKRFGQVDYDEIYCIYDKTRLKQSYEELLEYYKDEEYAEEMAKDNYFQQALSNSLNGDEVVDLLNQLNDENERLKHKLLQISAKMCFYEDIPIEFEQWFFTEIAEPSDCYDKETLSKITNALLGD